jgi:hypothetical protein
MVPDGTPFDVAKSCLQKAILSGDDLGAVYWALQLSVRSRGSCSAIARSSRARMSGSAPHHALPVVLAARTAYEQTKKESRNPRPDAVLVVWPALYLAPRREEPGGPTIWQHASSLRWCRQPAVSPTPQT